MGDIEIHVTHDNVYVSHEGVRCLSCLRETRWNSDKVSTLGHPCVAMRLDTVLLPSTLFLSRDPVGSLAPIPAAPTRRPLYAFTPASTDGIT